MALPGEPPFVSWNHAHSEALPPQSGWTTQFIGVSFNPNSQIGAAYAHTEAIQALVRARGFTPSNNPAVRGDTPLCTPRVYVLAQGVHRKSVDFSPKSALRIWWFSHVWTFSWENCAFSSKWNHLWCLKALFAIKGLTGLQSTACSHKVHG